MNEPSVDLVLVHYPVHNRRGETIGSAVTNLDIHDIARAACTYGVGTYWIVTPYLEQQRLTRRIIEHWVSGYGSQNPDRGQALSLIRVSDSLDAVLEEYGSQHGRRPLVVATSAQAGGDTMSFTALRDSVSQGQPVLLLFGTAWGLTGDVLNQADAMLEPIDSGCGFNHLSVRSAASIVLDRLLGQRVQ